MPKAIDELLKSRTIFTALFFGTFCFLIWQNRSIPDDLSVIVSTLLGYWFGSRTAEKLKTGGANEQQK
jgi:hypothetical protein